MSQPDERAILINNDYRFFKTRNCLAIHKTYYAEQWEKKVAIFPTRQDFEGWELIPYDRVNPRSQYYATLNEVDAWLMGKYNFSLTPETIEHLENLEAKKLMYQMAKDKRRS